MPNLLTKTSMHSRRPECIPHTCVAGQDLVLFLNTFIDECKYITHTYIYIYIYILVFCKYHIHIWGVYIYNYIYREREIEIEMCACVCILCIIHFISPSKSHRDQPSTAITGAFWMVTAAACRRRTLRRPAKALQAALKGRFLGLGRW